MELKQAYGILGLDEGVSGPPLQDAFASQEKKLRSMLEQAPTPGLQAKYRKSLKRLEDAFQTVHYATDISELPSLAPVAVAEPAPTAAPPAGDTVARSPRERRPAERRRRSHLPELIAIFLVILACGGGLGYWFGVHQPRLKQENLALRTELANWEGEAERLEKILDRLENDRRDVSRLSDEARRAENDIMLAWAERRRSLFDQVSVSLADSWRIEALQGQIKNARVLVEAQQHLDARRELDAIAARIEALPAANERFWTDFERPLMVYSFQTAETARFASQYQPDAFNRYLTDIKERLASLDQGADATVELQDLLERLRIVSDNKDPDLQRWNDLLLTRLYLRNPPPTILGAVREAVAAYQGERWKEAEVMFWNIARQEVEPTPAFHFAFGEILVRLAKYQEAIERLQLAAAANDLEAQVLLGRVRGDASLKGIHNVAEAEKFWAMAAEQGHAEAQFWVGHYRFAAGDVASAAEWLQRSADQGFAEAQFLLGQMYLEGKGVSADPATGARLVQGAALQGKTEAEFALGRLYDDGSGVPLDEAEANAWYARAAQRGYSAAAFLLGRRVLDGIGGSRDFSRAQKLLLQAGDAGHGEAYYLIGDCYENAKQVSRSYRTASGYYEKAVQKGYSAARARHTHLTENKTCPDCSGQGSWTEYDGCSHCGSDGEVTCTSCWGNRGQNISNWNRCTSCNGSGRSIYNSAWNCPVCNGHGGSNSTSWQACGSCDGWGEIQCYRCKGQGQHARTVRCSGRCGADGVYRLVEQS